MYTDEWVPINGVRLHYQEWGRRDAARDLWWRAFTSLRCPILLVRGADSDILSAETADEMQRRQPTMLRVDVPGVGHAPTLAEPAAVAALDRFYLASS